MGPRAGLERCTKTLPHRDSIRGPPSPQRVAVLTTLSQVTNTECGFNESATEMKMFQTSALKLLLRMVRHNPEFKNSIRPEHFYLNCLRERLAFKHVYKEKLHFNIYCATSPPSTQNYPTTGKSETFFQKLITRYGLQQLITSLL